LLHGGGGVFVDLHHLAHRALPEANGCSQFFAGVHRCGTFRQCCRKVCTGTLVGLCPGLDLRPQFQGDLAQLPFVQVAAALLGIQRPLLGL
ncbi:ACT domain-containing protein, partial [Dysosmobacter welbionis]